MTGYPGIILTTSYPPTTSFTPYALRTYSQCTVIHEISSFESGTRIRALAQTDPLDLCMALHPHRNLLGWQELYFANESSEALKVTSSLLKAGNRERTDSSRSYDYKGCCVCASLFLFTSYFFKNFKTRYLQCIGGQCISALQFATAEGALMIWNQVNKVSSEMFAVMDIF